MALDLLTFGEALVEVMRIEVGSPLDRPAGFIGPYPSGAPFIFAVQAARLGMQSGVIGTVGADAFGRCLLEQLQADGVDFSGVHVSKTHTTGVAFIAYNADGTRDFVFHAKQAAAGQLSADMLAPALFDGLRCLHVTGSALSLNEGSLELGRHALWLAKERGAKVSFDPNIRPQLLPVEEAVRVYAEFVRAADVLLPTADELKLLTNAATLEDAVAALWEVNPGCLMILTQGSAGCVVYQNGAPPIHVPAFNVQEVDPTGAGDCFDAGFLARWLAGDDLTSAARFGNACGALAVTAMGPMAGARRLDEVRAFISSG